MPWYGREFYADENVLVMTLEQEAAYLRLLWNCWQEGSIPTDIAKLAALCKNFPQKKFERDIWPALCNLFVARDDGRLVHHKVELLRAAKEQLRAKWSEGARLANEKRWGGDRSGIAERSGGHQRQIPAEYRIPNTEYRETNICAPDGAQGGGALELAPPKPERTDETKEWFDRDFWPVYPRKRAKPQALRAARRHGKTATDRAAIMECLKRRLPALQEQFKADGDYRPYPERWLNQQPWLDPVEVGMPAAALKPAGGGGGAVTSGIEQAMRLLNTQEKES